jgi:hypothetical protein
VKEHIMENGDLAYVKPRHVSIKGCLVKIVNCVEPSRILVRVMTSPDDDIWYTRFPTWLVPYDYLTVITDSKVVDQLEAEICFKNL